MYKYNKVYEKNQELGGKKGAPLDYGAYMRKKGEVSYWLGASSIKVSKGKEKGKACGGGIRGAITEFSVASRRNFRKKLGKIKKEEMPILVGLTYPGQFVKEPRKWKRDLRKFNERLVYEFGNVAEVWKLEPQKRAAPHFHLLIWGVSYIDLLVFCNRAWYEVVGSSDYDHLIHGAKVEKVKNWSGVMTYVAKYVGKKVESLPGWENVGRYWGIFMSKNVPWAELVEEAVTYRQAVQLMRYFRRYAHVKGRDYKSLEILVKNVDYWYERKDDLFRSDWKRNYRNSKEN